MSRVNPYEPIKAVIREVIEETPTIKTFRLELDEPMEFATGQFIQLTVPGVGECPFTPSSKPGKSRNMDVTVMKVGTATEVLHRKTSGDMLAVRGPYGNGFPLDFLKNKELLIVGGGCGMAPLRSLLYEIIENKQDYPSVSFLYGCRTPEDILYKGSFPEWKKEIDFERTVDKASEEWKESEGVVTKLFENVKVNLKKCVAVIVGPPVMMKFATMELEKKGVSDDRIIVSLEKNMTCGFGKCRHCLCGPYYVCKDGPVFFYKDVKDLPDVWD
ncbi:MAG: FAD/NAD(P)-binding protein [Elusimicrobia bacterium]|nr:FAD/NAD(P)-binding protein [Elusimicrobiota bacterium]